MDDDSEVLYYDKAKKHAQKAALGTKRRANSVTDPITARHDLKLRRSMSHGPTSARRQKLPAFRFPDDSLSEVKSQQNFSFYFFFRYIIGGLLLFQITKIDSPVKNNETSWEAKSTAAFCLQSF